MGKNSIHKIKSIPRYSKPSSAILIEDEGDLIDLITNTENVLLLILEGIQDPHNLGACLRTSSGAGVHAVIAPMKGACGITNTVRDVSCGGADDVPFLKVKNIPNFLRKLKNLGIQIIGTSDKASASLYQAKLDVPTALVLGNEGLGLRKITSELCDCLISIPMAGQVNCLNVSVSAGVCLYEAIRQRKTI